MYGGTRQVSSFIGTMFKYEYTLCLKGEAFPYVSIIHIKYTRTANLIKKNLRNDKQTAKCKVQSAHAQPTPCIFINELSC